MVPSCPTAQLWASGLETPGRSFFCPGCLSSPRAAAVAEADGATMPDCQQWVVSGQETPKRSLGVPDVWPPQMGVRAPGAGGTTQPRRARRSRARRNAQDAEKDRT